MKIPKKIMKFVDTSLGLILPADVVREMKLSNDDIVLVDVIDNKIVIEHDDSKTTE